jgi:hypothetical protein
MKMPGPESLAKFSADELRSELKAREGTGTVSESLRNFASPAIFEVLLDKEREALGASEVLDLFQVTDPQLLRDADSVVALFTIENVKDNGDGTSTLVTDSFGDLYNLCPGEQFREQPAGAAGAGVLVAPDVIATAGQSLHQEMDPKNLCCVFGFRMQNATAPVLTLNNSDIYRGKSLLAAQSNPSEPDWALIRLDRPVKGHRIARLQMGGKIADGAPVHVIGHPVGLPVKVASGASVKENDQPAIFTANLAALGGNVGAPVFNSSTHEVAGLLGRGGTVFVSKGTCKVVLVCPATGCAGWDCTRSAQFAALVPQWRNWQNLGGICMSPPSVQPAPPDQLHAWVQGVEGAAWHWFWTSGHAANGVWEGFGGTGMSPPTVTMRGQSADVWMLGPDSSLYHLPRADWPSTPRVGGRWGIWESLGGWCHSPVIVSRGPTSVDAFVIGTDHALWHNAWNGAAWSGWQSRGGWCASPPTVVSWGPNRLDAFVLGTDHGVYQQIWDGSAWGGWQHVGDIVCSSPPTVISTGPNRLDAFVLGIDHALSHTAWDGSRWTDWQRLDDRPCSSPPTVVSRGSELLDLFILATDAAVYHQAWNGRTWSDRISLGSLPCSSPPAAVSWGVDRLDVFALGMDSVLYHQVWDGAMWSGWENLGLTCSSPPSVVSMGPNRLDVFVLGTDSALYHRAWS